jgi:hypothetical protein
MKVRLNISDEKSLILEGMKRGSEGEEIDEHGDQDSIIKNFRLHPLIHTFIKFNLAQDIGSINKQSRSSAVL